MKKATTPKAALKHNFGMARPEGYRKAARLMDTGRPFRLPVISLVDTPGPFPASMPRSAARPRRSRVRPNPVSLGVPNVAVIIGEGGSGGAIAIAAANRVLMLEHAIYTVALAGGFGLDSWRDAAKAQEAATNMKITAQDLLRFGIIDTIIPEPTGGAHRDPAAAIAAAGNAIAAALNSLGNMSPDALRDVPRRKIPGDGPEDFRTLASFRLKLWPASSRLFERSPIACLSVFMGFHPLLTRTAAKWAWDVEYPKPLLSISE